MGAFPMKTLKTLGLLGLLAFLALPLAAADMRSAVFAAVVARSGETSNCSLFSSMFAPDGVYESPVGSGWKVGPAAIEADCEAWNALIGPQGNGWYPGALYSSELGNRTSFTLQIRTVSKGGCKTVRAHARRRTLCRGAPEAHRRCARSPARPPTQYQDIHGIVTVEFDTASQALLRWFHYYVSPSSPLTGACGL